MYIDAELQLSDAQALSSAAAVVGQNVIDLGVAQSIGNGEPMCVMFSVLVDADQADGDEDYTFEVEYASNAGQTTGRQLMGRRIFESGTPTAPAQDADLLVEGFKFFIPVPPTTDLEDEQFLGIRTTLAGTTPAITFDAVLMPMSTVDATVDYASGFTIT